MPTSILRFLFAYQEESSDPLLCHPACPGLPWDRTPDLLLRGATNDHVSGFQRYEKIFFLHQTTTDWIYNGVPVERCTRRWRKRLRVPSPLIRLERLGDRAT
jgi:hypothetical protein